MSRKRSATDQHAPCFRCFKISHSSEECTSNGYISCANCFRLNVFTKTCNCQDYTQPPPSQTLRLVGKSNAPRWFLDLQINNRIFAALVNPTLERGRVSKSFAIWLRSTTGETSNSNTDAITVNIHRQGQVLQITCDVSNNQEEHIHIGADLLKFLKYTFTIDGCTIDSSRSYIAPNPHEVNYAYNLPILGEDLRAYLTRKKFFLKNARTITSHYGVTHCETKRLIRISPPSSESSNENSDIES